MQTPPGFCASWKVRSVTPGSCSGRSAAAGTAQPATTRAPRVRAAAPRRYLIRRDTGRLVRSSIVAPYSVGLRVHGA
ncbi:Uncharacterised protein [Mycobacteroides abscessus]|nr:Uncharacterised protein [Mycobacteroides abscessus]